MQEAIGKQGTSVPWKLLLLIPLAAVAVILALQFDLRELLRRTLDSISSLGVWGPVLFVLLYIVASVCFVPASILTLGAGAVFGVIRGTLYVTVGATLGATAAFLVSRYLARDWIARKIEGNRTFTAIDEAVAREGGKIVMLTRLSPIFPFILLNYAFGITKVSLRSYFFGSAIGMLPASLVYVYIGSIAGKVATAGKGGSRTAGEWALLGAGLVATIIVTLFITRLARRALQAKISS
jgi:uncharacterized membrane protein YdjX (TVP38/TMEM64 family)